MIKKIFQTFTIDIVVFCIGIGNSIIINRTLGPKQLGAYFLVTTIASLIVKVISMGIEVSNSTFVSKDRTKTRSLFLQSIIISLISGLSVLFLLLVGINIFSIILKGVESHFIIPALLSIPILLYLLYWNALMVGLSEISFLNKFNLLTSVMSLFISVSVLILFNQGLTALLYAYLINNMLLSIYGGYVLLNKVKEGRLSLDSAIFKESFILGIKTHLGNIAHFIFHRIDYFLVNYFLETKAVGYYGLATSIAERIWMIISPVYTVSFAKITSAPLMESIELVMKILRGAIFLLACLSGIIAISGYWLIKIMYGNEYLPAFPPLIILLPGTMLLGASWFLGLFFIGRIGKPEITTKIAWVGLSISIPLYVVLIQTLGILGAAVASSITYTFIFWATLYHFKKLYDFPLRTALIIKKSDIAEVSNAFSQPIVLK